MRNLLRGLLLVTPVVANAAVFDFTTLGANNTPLANSVTVNGVTASGHLHSGFTLTTPALLWLRNQPSDHGLGVCSELSATGATTPCSTGGGDVNELSNQANPEAIRLERPVGTTWTSLWVSSLDEGGTGGSEEGMLLWSNTADFSVVLGSFVFKYPDFGAGVVEGDLLTLGAAAGFDETAMYLLFINNPNSGTNNDYLVWKGAYEGPQRIGEPGTLLLLGAALGVLGLRRRRS